MNANSQKVESVEIPSTTQNSQTKKVVPFEMEKSDTEEFPSTSHDLRRMVAGNERGSRVSFSEIDEPLGLSDSDFYDEFLHYHNSFRKLHSCPPLTQSKPLMVSASKRVEVCRIECTV